MSSKFIPSTVLNYTPKSIWLALKAVLVFFWPFFGSVMKLLCLLAAPVAILTMLPGLSEQASTWCGMQ